MDPTLLLIIGGGLGVLLLIGAGAALLSGGNRVNVDERLEQFSGSSDWVSEEFAEAAADAPQAELADRLDDAISGQGFSFFDTIKSRIAKSDIKLRVTEYLGLVLIFALIGGIVGYFLFGGLAALPIAFLGMQFPRIYLSTAATKRIRKFDEQLSDTLNLWVNSLRSGFSVLQGMEAIATELPPPISKEFERVVQEVRLGIEMEQALDNALRRVPSEDFDLVVTAVNIQREVGGNLAEILDIISFTIRERVRIKGEIRALTAQGRMSGWVITLLPIILTLILFGINREYIMELFTSEAPFVIEPLLPCGWLMVGIGIIMISSGAFAIQKIVDIEV